jgi:flagella basal body P-ring formation protein FlgA
MARKALAFLLLLSGSPAYAAAGAGGFEDLGKLEARLVGALDVDVGQPGGPIAHLDRRLKLQPCPVAAVIDPPALGAIALRCEPLGWRIRVPLMKTPTQTIAAAPAIYTPAQPATPPVIKRGDPVQLVAGTDGFSVTSQAVAQEDGQLGGAIRVKSDARGPVVIGRVEDAGRVRVASN